MKNAKIIHGKRDCPINMDRVVNHVVLQLSTEAEKDLNELDIEKVAKDREMFEKAFSEHGNILLNQLFSEAQKVARNAASQLNNYEAQQNYLNRHGNIVVITGPAGIGKTTLSRMVVKLRLDDKLFEKQGFIFYIRFREIRFNTPITLLQLLLTGSNISWNYCQWFDQKLINSLEDGSSILIIMDGLDEANTTAFTSSASPQITASVVTADEHIKRLILGKVLPKAQKLITSRPRQFLDLHAELKPKLVVRVLGLGREAQLNISTQICQGQPLDVFDKTQDFLNKNPRISSLCFVPVLCILINFVVSRDIADKQTTDIQSLTAVFVKTLKYFSSGPNFKGEHAELGTVAKLAWEGFRDGKLIFDQTDFIKYGLSAKKIYDFLVPHIDREDRFQINILEGSVKTTFTHLTWQELFTAIHIVFFSPEEKLQEIFPDLMMSKFDFVANFVFGLLDEKNASDVSKVFNLSKTNHFVKNKRKLVALAKNIASTVTKDDLDSVKIISKWLCDLKIDDAAVQIFSLLCDQYLQGVIDTSNVSTLIKAFKLSQQPIHLCAKESGKKLNTCLINKY